MGYAMLKGALKVFDKSEIIFSDANEDRMKRVEKETGVEYVLSNAECANLAKYIVLAVKPQYFDVVLRNIENIVTPEHVVISIAAGIKMDYLQSGLGSSIRIVRAMPNTPALLGEGMTGITYDAAKFNFEEQEVIKKLFTSIGRAKRVEESMMNTVTCASGSSPAYVYMFIEALADSAVKYGMQRADAYEFVAQTVMGSAKMVLETKAHPGLLKDMVCSPAGTTIAGVEELEAEGFRSAIMKATDACYARAKELEAQ
jgi:pyrroline-5-carboxylate reductase